MSIEELDAWATEVFYIVGRHLRVTMALTLTTVGIFWSVALIIMAVKALIEWVIKEWRKRNKH